MLLLIIYWKWLISNHFQKCAGAFACPQKVLEQLHKTKCIRKNSIVVEHEHIRVEFEGLLSALRPDIGARVTSEYI